jgi:peptidoglycan/LPS O-acetylase OafA/YrhL
LQAAAGKPPNFMAFLQNRLARIFPVYYACNILALPVFFAGYTGTNPIYTGAVIASIVVTVFAQNTMILLANGNAVPIDGPSWTVGTLLWWVDDQG